MTVGQNSSTKGGVSVNCYIQKQTDSNKDDITKYHLLQIFSKFVKKSGNDSYYDVSIYIDGRMEASFPSLSNSPLLVKQLQINNANVYINTIDVDYLPVSNVSENSDYDVYQYYLKYRSEIIVDQSEDFQSELSLREDLKKFKVGLNGRVITDGATISNIAEKTSTPILVMTCQDNGTGEPIIDRLERNYGEDGAGIGNDFQTTSLSNCFVVGNKKDSDSYGGILKIDQELVQLQKRRGGVGTDLSFIRPAGSPVKNSAITSTGVVPFMKRYSNSTNEVAQDGRRGALMLSLSIKHPDVENFIDAKLQKGQVTGANISVKIDDEFMQAVLNKEPYLQKYPIDIDVNKDDTIINIDDMVYNKTANGNNHYTLYCTAFITEEE